MSDFFYFLNKCKMLGDRLELGFSIFRNALKPHVSDISKWGLHSPRAGGASKAANMGISDRFF